MKIKGKMWSGAAVTCSCLRPPDAEPPLTRRRPQTLHDLIFCPSVFVRACVRACMCVCEWGFYVVAIVFLVMLIKKLCCCDSEGRKMQQRHLLNVEISFFSPLWHFSHEWETTFFSFSFFSGSPVLLFWLVLWWLLTLCLCGSDFFSFFSSFFFKDVNTWSVTALSLWPQAQCGCGGVFHGSALVFSLLCCWLLLFFFLLFLFCRLVLKV